MPIVTMRRGERPVKSLCERPGAVCSMTNPAANLLENALRCRHGAEPDRKDDHQVLRPTHCLLRSAQRFRHRSFPRQRLVNDEKATRATSATFTSWLASVAPRREARPKRSDPRIEMTENDEDAFGHGLASSTRDPCSRSDRL